MNPLKSLLFLISTAVLFLSCKKDSQDDLDAATCENMRNLTITSNSPVLIGEEIRFSVPEVGGFRVYSWNGPDNFREQYPEQKISYAELKHEGWYYIAVSNNTCDTKIDSVYIDVKLVQGSASCTVAANQATFNNQASDSYSSVIKGIEPNYGLKALQASGGGNMTIYFHPYWRTKEPEDGIYSTINIPLFGQTDENYNKLFVTTTKSSIYWGSQEGQQAYVSHINGKLQVRFCSLNMSGSNGNSYITIASANVVQL